MLVLRSALIFPGISADPWNPKWSVSMRQTFNIHFILFFKTSKQCKNIHLLVCYDTEAGFNSEFIICEATKPAIYYYKLTYKKKTKYKKAYARHYLKYNCNQKTKEYLFSSPFKRHNRYCSCGKILKIINIFKMLLQAFSVYP